jgi:hypothetical protein
MSSTEASNVVAMQDIGDAHTPLPIITLPIITLQSPALVQNTLVHKAPDNNGVILDNSNAENYYSAAVSSHISVQYLSTQVLHNPASSREQRQAAQHRSNQAGDQLREIYLEIFRKQEREHLQQPNWWKEQFLKSGEELQKDLLATSQASALLSAVDTQMNGSVSAATNDQAMQPNTNNNNSNAGTAFEDEFSVGIQEQLHCFLPRDKSVITIGRYPGCDILPSAQYMNDAMSRLHAIVYLFPMIGIVLVVDVGSFTGIVTVKRASTTAQCISSVPSLRQVLSFGWKEGVLLRLGTFTVQLWAKACVVCLSRPRNQTFAQCRHYCVCEQCVQRLDKCPVCRTSRRLPLDNNNQNNNNNNSNQNLNQELPRDAGESLIEGPQFHTNLVVPRRVPE